jgi:predicted transcriptional regulator
MNHGPNTDGGLLQVDSDLQHRIEEFARAFGVTPADVIREAFENFEASRHQATGPSTTGETLYDAFQEAGLIGCLADAPPDLSTNQAYFEGFGRE